MGEGQRPTGRLGLSRVTDVGPLVSHHNTEPTECDVKLAFDGHSKGEVVKSIRDAWVSEVDEFKTSLNSTDLEFYDVAITGSVVEGNFGCRSVEKAQTEIDLVSRNWSFHNPAAPDAAREIVKQDTIMGMWEKANELLGKLDESELLLEDTRFALISDIDVFVVVEDQDEAIEMETARDSSLREKMEEFKSNMRRKKKGNMPFIINFMAEDNPRLMDGVLRTREDFNEIVRRHY